MPAAAVTPVTVLTGFLGSGKTTLLDRLVRDERFRDTAIVVNEWGEVAIDHAMLRSASGDVAVLAAGCICCRAAGDVVRALRELHFDRLDGRVPAFTRAVIETTGLADPAPLLATLAGLPLIGARYALAGVVTTVDAEHGTAALDRHPESVKQAALADRIVVTKTDRADEAVVAALEARLAALNPAAALLRSERLDLARIMDAGLHRASGLPLDARGWLNAGAYRPAGAARGPRHDARISSFAWRREEPCRWGDVEAGLERLVERIGERMLRMKGLVHVAGEAGPRAVHAVQHTLYPSARIPEWPDDDRATRLAFIACDLEAAEAAAILDRSIPRATP